LDARYGIRLAQVALPLVVVYVVADVGSIGGGWLSGALIKRGWTVNRARKTALLAMALLIVPTALAPPAGSMSAAVAIVSVAAAGVSGVGLAPSFPLPPLWSGGQGVRPSAPPAPLLLGVASYSLRSFPRDKAIDMVKALGKPYINLKSVHLPYELSPEELAAA